VPKLYEYFGLVVHFYSNEHAPIHVHGEYQGRESKAELYLEKGEVVRIIFTTVAGRRPLARTQLKNFKAVVAARSEDIVRRWVDYFVLRKHNSIEVINRRLS
jgi:hypothetical protein